MKIIGYDYEGKVSLREIRELEVVRYDTNTKEGLYRIKASYRNYSYSNFYIDKGPLDNKNWEKRLFENINVANKVVEELFSNMTNDIIDLRKTKYVMTYVSGVIQTVFVSNEPDCFDEDKEPLLVKIVDD